VFYWHEVIVQARLGEYVIDWGLGFHIYLAKNGHPIEWTIARRKYLTREQFLIAREKNI